MGKLILLYVMVSITIYSSIVCAEDLYSNSSNLTAVKYTNVLSNKPDYRPFLPSLVVLTPSDNEDSNEIHYLLSFKQSQWENSRDSTDIYGFLNIRTDPSIFNEMFKFDGEMAYNPTDELDVQQGFRQYAPRMFRFNINGKIMGFEYGAVYRTFDEEFGKLQIQRNIKDKPGKELWIKRSFSVFALKSFVSDYLNNVFIDPSQPKVSKSIYGSSLEISTPNWPIINLSYSRGTSTTVRKLEKKEVQNDSIQSFTGFLYYWKSKWDVSLSSNLTLSTNNEQSDFKSKISTLEISGSYRPDWTLVITPSLGIVNENYVWSGGGVDYLMKYVSMSISYFPPSSPFSLILYAYYSNYISSDTYTDTNSLNGYAELTWKLGRNFLGDQKLSVEVGSYSYIDNVFSINNYNDFTTMITYKITGL